ncbi:hypothetical protein EDD86DRAFT_201239 [Gorgonomyces haynaldii]|nr:hypothetical protein EDD86DRAFT_201239 [Gorgonomyces haynaldii]
MNLPTFVKSPQGYVLTLVIITLDFLACLLALGSTLYDNASPALNSNTPFMFALTTNSTFWTAFRQSVFWISSAMRFLAFFEMVARVLTFGFETLSRPLDVLDNVFVVALIPVRFALTTRDGLVMNTLVLVRYLRLISFFYAVKDTVGDEAEKEIRKTERECQHILEHMRRQKEEAESKLEVAQGKLRVLMGYSN